MSSEVKTSVGVNSRRNRLSRSKVHMPGNASVQGVTADGCSKLKSVPLEKDTSSGTQAPTIADVIAAKKMQNSIITKKPLIKGKCKEAPGDIDLQQASEKVKTGAESRGEKTDEAINVSSRSFQNPGLNADDAVALHALQQSMASLNIGTAWENTNDISAYQNVKWGTLGVRPPVAAILAKVGFHYPSPVQVLSIPHALSGHDLLIRAKNGTGKTASFVIPILNRIDTARGIQAIILVPSRELVLQISKVLMVLGNGLGIKSAPLVGGTDLTTDIMRLTAGVHAVVATPGRALDLLSKKLCAIEKNVTLVFDEADKLLDSVFYSSVCRLLDIIPRTRQLLLYSATFPHSIEGFVNLHMRDPIKLKVSDQSLQTVEQYYVRLKPTAKLLCLRSLLSSLSFDQCIIYCNSRGTVKSLAQKITEFGLSTYFIYSDMAQEERNIVYHNFSNKKCKILVSTDITTRGIDVPSVNVVINYDLPGSSESYLHRVGRAGRFGAEGCAINFIKQNEFSTIQQYERALGLSILPISDETFRKFCK